MREDTIVLTFTDHGHPVQAVVIVVDAYTGNGPTTYIDPNGLDKIFMGTVQQAGFPTGQAPAMDSMSGRFTTEFQPNVSIAQVHDALDSADVVYTVTHGGARGQMRGIETSTGWLTGSMLRRWRGKASSFHAKLVIFGGCDTASTDDLASGLGVTKVWTTQGHAFLGGVGNVNNLATLLAVNFILEQMGAGKTIGQALDEARQQHSVAQSFQLYGDRSVTLSPNR